MSSEAVRAAGSLAEVNCRPRRDSRMSAFLGTAAAPGRARSDLQAHCLVSRRRGKAACVAILPPGACGVSECLVEWRTPVLPHRRNAFSRFPGLPLHKGVSMASL